MTITIRQPFDLYRAGGQIQDGSFQGLWHFSFDRYRDYNWLHFGTLRVFNDDILSPGATWPLHPHRRNEVVTYVAKGEFLHEDENGKAQAVMTKGDVQHTTVGRGMYHAEINNRDDEEMRFLQLWFFPEEEGLEPNFSQKNVEQTDRRNRLLPLVSHDLENTLRIRSDARVYASFLENRQMISHSIDENWGVYLVNVEGGSLDVNGNKLEERGSAKIEGEDEIILTAEGDTEVFLVEVRLDAPYISKYV